MAGPNASERTRPADFFYVEWSVQKKISQLGAPSGGRICRGGGRAGLVTWRSVRKLMSVVAAELVWPTHASVAIQHGFRSIHIF